MSLSTGFRATLRSVGAAALLALAAAGLAPNSSAQTLRYASAFDPNSLDPHALALAYRHHRAALGPHRRYFKGSLTS